VGSPSSEPVAERVRSTCEWVAGRARFVHIERDAVGEYALGLQAAGVGAPLDPETHLVEGDRESRAAFVLCLDAINFGSGWWPTIRKRAGHSGYFTVAAGLTERFRDDGAWSTKELTELSPEHLASVLDQDPEHPLMSQYAASLRDVGEHVLAEHDGHFATLIDAARGSAVTLAEMLARWKAFADVSTYEDRPVPFFKRAQLAAADIARVGLAELRETQRLTAFADNVLPHVLRLDGILRLDPTLEKTIDGGQLLTHGSPPEVELRACAIHTVELLSQAIDGRLYPAQIDEALWNRGRESRYKAVRRPRSRNTAY
jgi:hypothetical protein